MRGIKLFLVIAMLLCVAPLSACDSSAAGATIYFDGVSMPKNIDPQLAASDLELTVAGNVFDGLFRMVGTEAKPALCGNYTVSDDKLEYKFMLVSGAMWSDKRPLTAHDFVFGIRRALDPATKSPNAHLLANIKGAADVLSGAKSVSTLAVSATDDNTLIIGLQSPDDRFTEALCNPVSYPCNEEFFIDCKGRYGLIGDMVLSCGPFYLSRWRENANMRLIRNENYKGTFKATPKQAIISFTKGDDERVTRFLDGSLDLVYIGGDQLGRVQTAGLNTLQTENTAYILVCSNTNAFFSDSEVRKALFCGLDRSQCIVSAPAYFRSLKGMIPDTAISLEAIYRPNKEVNIPFSFNAGQAHAKWISLTKNNSKAPSSVTLHYPDDGGMQEIAGLMAQSWQQNLGLYVTLSALPRNKMPALVRGGDFQIALYPVSPATNDAKSYLTAFSSGEPLENYSSQDFKSAYNNIGRNLGEREYIARVGAAEQALLDSMTTLPMVSGGAILAIGTGIDGVQTGRSGNTVYFYDIIKP